MGCENSVYWYLASLVCPCSWHDMMIWWPWLSTILLGSVSLWIPSISLFMSAMLWCDLQVVGILQCLLVDWPKECYGGILVHASLLAKNIVVVGMWSRVLLTCMAGRLCTFWHDPILSLWVKPSTTGPVQLYPCQSICLVGHLVDHGYSSCSTLLIFLLELFWWLKASVQLALSHPQAVWAQIYGALLPQPTSNVPTISYQCPK